MRLAGDWGALTLTEPPRTFDFFSTDFVPVRDRLPFFKEEFARKMARLDVVPLSDDDFRVDIAAQMLGDIRCVRLDTTPAAFGREGGLLNDGSDHFVLLINRGPALFDDCKQCMIATGEATLQDTTRQGYVRLAQGGGGLSIAIPRQLLVGIVPEAEDLVTAGVLGNSAPMELLARYVETIMLDGEAGHSMLHAAGSHVLDLIALGLEGSADAIHYARRNGLKASRWMLMRRFVRDRLRDPALSLPQIACNQGVSERYVQMLFEHGGTSFTEYVLEQRLQLARRELANPLRRHMRIADLAYSCGFGDVSHFNHSYRRRFGETPSDTRKHDDRSDR